MFCNLGNQVGGLSHGLEPHKSKKYSFLSTLMPMGPDNEKVGTGPIFNVNTPIQRLRHIDIPYGNTIPAWDMDWFLIFYLKHT